MKNILFITCLFFFLCPLCHAQNDAKVFFFRNDHTIPLDGGITNYQLYINDSLRKIHNHSFYEYTTNKSSENYFVKLSWMDWPYNKGKFTSQITTNPGTITFVEIRKLHRYSNKISLNKISLKEIEEIYKHKGWFRKKLSEAGYKSVDELIKGYRVNE